MVNEIEAHENAIRIAKRQELWNWLQMMMSSVGVALSIFFADALSEESTWWVFLFGAGMMLNGYYVLEGMYRIKLNQKAAEILGERLEQLKGSK